jgi:hypothetical protein
MSFENDLHDWYIDGIMVTPSEITLSVHLYEARKKLKFTGVTRCLLDNLLMMNIIYSAKIASMEEAAELFREEITRLERSYPAKGCSGTGSKILSINGAVGLDGVIEFDDVEIEDL